MTMSVSRGPNEYVCRIRVAGGAIECTYGTNEGPIGTATSRVPSELSHVDSMLTDMWLRAHQSLKRSRAASMADPIRDIGTGLFDAIVPPAAQRLYRSTMLDAAQGTGRVRLVLENLESAEVPWELLYDSERRDFVALSDRTTLVRATPRERPPRPPGQQPIQVLLVTAEPTSTSLMTDEDLRIFRELEERAGDRVAVRYLVNADAAALDKALEAPFDVFYFSGTTPQLPEQVGERARSKSRDPHSLVLCARNGQAGRAGLDYPAAALAERFQVRPPRLAVFSACRSSGVAWMVAHAADSVVGAYGDVAADDCIRLCERLCSYLERPTPIDGVVTAARQAFDLMAPGARQWTRFVFHLEGPTGELFVPRQERFTWASLANAADAAPESPSVGRLLRLMRLHEQNIVQIESKFPASADRPAVAVEQLESLRQKVALLSERIDAETGRGRGEA